MEDAAGGERVVAGSQGRASEAKPDGEPGVGGSQGSERVEEIESEPHPTGRIGGEGDAGWLARGGADNREPDRAAGRAVSPIHLLGGEKQRIEVGPILLVAQGGERHELPREHVDEHPLRARDRRHE